MVMFLRVDFFSKANPVVSYLYAPSEMVNLRLLYFFFIYFICWNGFQL